MSLQGRFLFEEVRFFSLLQPVGSILPRVVLHLGNGKRERLPLRACKEPVGPSSIYFRVVTCLTCLSRVADSRLLFCWSLLLCAYAVHGVKFGHAFPLNILQLPNPSWFGYLLGGLPISWS